MATPLRKEHPEFDDEKEITTADLAQGKRPTSETRGPQAVQTERAERTSSPLAASDSSVANETRTTGSAWLIPGGELEGLRTRWKQVQTEFVDQPRKAVGEADGLVAWAMKRLAGGVPRRAVPAGAAVRSRGGCFDGRPAGRAREVSVVF